jgi:hypothetical protein
MITVPFCFLGHSQQYITMLLAIKYLLLLASIVLPATCQDPIRIVAVADLHGDYDNSLSVLQMANVVDDKAQWIGGNNTIFVQTVYIWKVTA